MPTPVPIVSHRAPGPWIGLALFACLASLASPSGSAAPGNTSVPSPGEAFADVPSPGDIDPATFSEWVDGRETVIDGTAPERSPGWVLWTTKSQPGHSALAYGASDKPGVRHLRIGFTTSRALGTVLVHGGGVLSVLKPRAAYPGDLSDESQWEPALRLLPGGEASNAPVGRDQLGVWVLPEGTRTRALRFSTDSASTDSAYRGSLGGALVTSERLMNAAVLATASANSGGSNAAKLLNEDPDGWGAWDNVATNTPTPDRLPLVSADHPELILLTWDRPVLLDGLVLTWAGFTAAEVQAYQGPAERHPREALEGDWTPVGAYGGIEHGYPKRIWPNRLAFGRTLTTRALRLRIIGPPPPGVHEHVKGRDLGGRRVWLGEVWALRDMGRFPLASIKRPETGKELPKPPIAVRFALPEPGYVTLVIEKPDGTRVRNLVSETFFPAGENTAWWDGTDDLGRDLDAANHGLYRIPARFVEPGEYRVRGLVRGEITPVFEFSVYAPGNPPWSTDDHTGAWLANHSPPSAAAFVPAAKSPTGEPVVFLGAYVTEGPDGLAWVDLDGRKRGGKKWIGGNWTAAPFLAADLGPRSDPSVHAYVGSVWETEKESGKFELRITALTPKEDRPILKTLLTDLPGAPGASPEAGEGNRIGGLAAWDGFLVITLPDRNHLVFIGAADGKILGAVRLAAPRGVAFDGQGRLLATSGSQLVRFATVSDPAAVAPPEVLVPSGLDEPVAIALDEAGAIYISDRGKSHQVKVFAPDGAARRAYGKPGVPSAGPYDPERMNHPAGIAVDSRGQLWVTEEDFLPKRVSVWAPDGRLVRAFYGPGKYGGGGSLDPADPSKFYYADEHHGSLEFALDWKSGGHHLTRVLYRQDRAPMDLAVRSAAPETALHFGGRRYFTNCYNSNPVNGHGTGFLFVEHEGVARPAAAMGRAESWNQLREEGFLGRWPAGIDPRKEEDLRRKPVFFLWHDLNADALAQPEEVEMTAAASGGVTILNDLSFLIARLDGKTVRFAPEQVNPGGYPRYRLSGAETLATGVLNPASSGGDQALRSEDGWTVVSLGIEPFSTHSLSGAKDGVAKWSYPNLWPGLHASHTAPLPDHPGQLIGPTRLLGGLMQSRVGPLWAINGNHGCVYLFTADGLFVATLFADMRQGTRWRMPQAERGMFLKGLTLGDENFWPSITQTTDGTVFLADGARSALVRLDGFDRLSRLPDATLVVSRDDLDRSQAWQIEAEAARQRERGSGVLTVLGRFQAPVVDGDLSDWPAAHWVDIDKRGTRAYFNADTKPYDVTGSVAVAAGRLYAAWRSGNPKLLTNSGELPTAPFKTGGALDLMIGSNPQAERTRKEPVPGDLRLLVTLVGGKPLALVYRAVVPGTPASAAVPFSSPWRTITFDRVDDISSQIEFAAGAGGEFEISVPLEQLQLQPSAGLTILGDIGILRGEGNVTTARVYWANKSTGITADVPSEAMLTPSLWGTWRFQPE